MMVMTMLMMFWLMCWLTDWRMTDWFDLIWCDVIDWLLAGFMFAFSANVYLVVSWNKCWRNAYVQITDINVYSHSRYYSITESRLLLDIAPMYSVRFVLKVLRFLLCFLIPSDCHSLLMSVLGFIEVPKLLMSFKYCLMRLHICSKYVDWLADDAINALMLRIDFQEFFSTKNQYMCNEIHVCA